MARAAQEPHAAMKNYFTHSGKQESREVTITDLDMGTFDYFCNPSILGRMQGQGSAVKDWRALPGGYPSIFGKNAGAGPCSKKLASATAGGLPRYLWQKCRGKAVQKKIGGGATPHLWEKCRGKAVQQKLASATAGGLPLYLWEKNAGAGQCSKKLERAFGKCKDKRSRRPAGAPLPLCTADT